MKRYLKALPYAILPSTVIVCLLFILNYFLMRIDDLRTAFQDYFGGDVTPLNPYKILIVWVLMTFIVGYFLRDYGDGYE